jgi:ADP-ribose pyrophosphatase YjhB (NUDIX family)
MTWKPHVTVAAVIEHNHQYLMVEENISENTVFNQPAGHLEPGESLLDAIRREVLEETAHCFTPEALIGSYLYELPDKSRSYLRFCFSGKVGDSPENRPLDKDIIATHWLSLEQLRQRQLRSPLVLQCIQDFHEKPLISLDHLHYLPA